MADKLELTMDQLSSIINTAISSVKVDGVPSYTRDSIEITDDSLFDFHSSQNLINDASASYFFLRELEYVQRQSRDTKQKALKGMLLIPVSSEAPEWADTITWRRLTKVGIAKVIADYAHDFPRADVYREEFSIKVKGLGASYGYSKREIMQARATNQPLDRERAMACKRAVDEKQDNVIWNGDSTYNIQGFIDYPGISSYTVPNGASASPLWVNKTPDEIIEDLNGIVDTVISTTNGVEAPDTLILPIEQFRLIASTQKSSASDKTILQWFLENNGVIKMVDWVKELDGAGAGSTDRFMVYKRDVNYLRVEIPQMYMEEPPQQKGKEFEVVAEQRTAGVLVYYPLSIAYGDGI